MDDQDRRRELGQFVRTRRERLSPKSVGLPKGAARRTPGLRREEVAQLASVSVTWYTWLEQGRDINVSAQALNTIARALRMDRTEQTHLFMLARQPLPPQPPPDEEATPVLRRVLANVGISPAYVTGRRWNVLAWNEAAEVVFGNFGAKMGRERNLLWRSFTDMETREPERRKVGSDARVSVEGVNYEVDPDLAGETVILWWGIFDNELYVEHGDKRFGPYAPVGGPIPLYRYRAFKKTSTQQRADLIEALAERSLTHLRSKSRDRASSAAVVSVIFAQIVINILS